METAVSIPDDIFEGTARPAGVRSYDIEHVLPENPDGDRGQFDEQQREVSTHRLGNMTLLESAGSRELGNKGFADKRRVFLDSELAVPECSRKSSIAGRRKRRLRVAAPGQREGTTCISASISAPRR